MALRKALNQVIALYEEVQESPDKLMICKNSADENSYLEYYMNHIDHIVDLVGVDHVGLGFDLCDDFFKYMSPDDIASMTLQRFDIIARDTKTSRN